MSLVDFATCKIPLLTSPNEMFILTSPTLEGATNVRKLRHSSLLDVCARTTLIVIPEDRNTFAFFKMAMLVVNLNADTQHYLFVRDDVWIEGTTTADWTDLSNFLNDNNLYFDILSLCSAGVTQKLKDQDNVVQYTLPIEGTSALIVNKKMGQRLLYMTRYKRTEEAINSECDVVFGFHKPLFRSKIVPSRSCKSADLWDGIYMLQSHLAHVVAILVLVTCNVMLRV